MLFHLLLVIHFAAGSLWAASPDEDANRISLGGLHGCVLSSPAEIRCWGLSDSGQTGMVRERETSTDTSVNVTTETGTLTRVPLTGSFKSIASGASRSCALTTEGQVKCWGSNLFGAAGAPIQTLRVAKEAGNKFFDTPLNFEKGRTVNQIAMSAFSHHACVVLDNDDLKCWGDNSSGQLGLGQRTSGGTRDFGDKLKVVNLGVGRHAVQVALAGFATCALLDNGDIKCFGQNENGLCAPDERFFVGQAKKEMGDGLLPVALGKHAPVRQLSCGNLHCCALFEDSRMKCWGENSNGQLGTGDPASRGRDSNTMGDSLPYADIGLEGPIVRIALGQEHSCAFNVFNLSKCWGSNFSGTIGLPDQVINRGRTHEEMGDSLEFVDYGTLSPIRAIVANGMRTCAWTTDNKIECIGIKTAPYLLGPFDLTAK